MRILPQGIGESLRIGPDLQIQVLGHRAQPVKLGIRAPKNIDVHRSDVFERIHRPAPPANSPTRRPLPPKPESRVRPRVATARA